MIIQLPYPGRVANQHHGRAFPVSRTQILDSSRRFLAVIDIECQIEEHNVSEGYSLRRDRNSQQHFGEFRHGGRKLDLLLQAYSFGHGNMAA